MNREQSASFLCGDSKDGDHSGTYLSNGRPAEHMVCWTSAQHAYIDCVWHAWWLLQLTWCTVPMLSVDWGLCYTVTTCNHSMFPAWTCPTISYTQLV